MESIEMYDIINTLVGRGYFYVNNNGCQSARNKQPLLSTSTSKDAHFLLGGKMSDIKLGDKFGRLTVVREAEKRKGNRYFLCVCSCGIKKDVRKYGLVKGKTKSCGCLARENSGNLMTNLGYEANTSSYHGMKKTPFYKVLNHIKDRCLNENNKRYKYYGGKGIKVCERWLKFSNFKDDMYESYLDHIEKFGQKNTTIERINRLGDYCISNCKWATYREQNRNHGNNRMLTYNGKTKTMIEWSEILNIKYTSLQYSLKKGLSLKNIVNNLRINPEYQGGLLERKL